MAGTATEPDVISLGYLLCAVAFLVLSLLLATSWKGRMRGGLMLTATAVSTLWAGALAALAFWPALQPLAALAEAGRYAAWGAFLLALLRTQAAARERLALSSPRVVSAFALCALLGVIPLLPESWLVKIPRQGFFIGYLLLAIGGLWLVEMLFRNTRPDQRWGIKFLCFGLGAMFAYDFFLYSHAVLFGFLESDLWAARGLVNALVVPLLAVTAARNPDWSLDIFVSRRMVVHTATLVVTGLYLIGMAAAGYYIRNFGGAWGAVLQVTFLFAALLGLLVLLFSGHVRARIRVFLNKHFFNYRYDYREEWLRFTRTLGTCRSEPDARECLIRALATLVDSAGGVLFARQGGSDYRPLAHWNLPEPVQAEVSGDAPLVRFLVERGWVIDRDEWQTNPELYEGLELPDWFAGDEQAWLLVPLFDADDLLGFVVLARPLAPVKVNWEVHDLLKTAAGQAATYLGQLEALEALSEARQFEGFHRLSAFILHDLKNIIAQQSLITRSAARHRDNPAFVDDALGVMEHSVSKMQRLLDLLKGGMANRRPVQFDLARVIEDVVAEAAASQPVPQFDNQAGEALLVADLDRVRAAIRNLVQNAQQATDPGGRVDVRLWREHGKLVVEVADTGCGMDAAFIRERLFRPFDTTKGDTGMGIGAYETREWARSMGGDLAVESTPGEGSRFRLRVPDPALDGEAETGMETG